MTEQTLKILIVDDNLELRHLLKTTFNVITNCEILMARTGSEALNIIRQERPHIVFLDIMMPGDIDGFGVCEFVKSSSAFKDCFVVILTAKTLQSDKEYGLSIGADKYITKPFSPMYLVEMVKEWRLEYLVKKETILVVEDDEDLLRLIAKTLRQEHYNVIATEKGTEAIEIIKSQKVDLVITDIMMPEKDGIEVIDEIFELNSAMPIIAITGNLFFISAASDQNFSHLLGVKHVLKKPFTLTELHTAVVNVLKPQTTKKAIANNEGI